MKQFSNFLNQIPREIRANVETYIGNQIVLFKPRQYITNAEVNIIDYHFAMEPGILPPTMLDKKKIEFGKNKILVVHPDTKIRCLENPPTMGYHALSIKKDFVSKISQEMGYNGEIRFSKIENPYSDYLKQSIYKLEREMKCFSNNCTLMYESLAIQITALLIREIESSFKKNPTVVDGGKHFVAIAIEYMNMFFDSNITINDICKEIYVTPFHFIRIFKGQTGMTPHEYLLDIRIDRAKDLLKARECTVTDAAKICGFVSLSHFSYVFRKKTGISPTGYKKQYFINNNN